MSTYNNGRRAPNVSQYIANLNTVSPQADLTAQGEFDLASDGLAFLNTEFFDFDASTFNHAQHAGDFIQSAQPPASAATDFQYAEFPTFPQGQFSNSPTSMTQSPPAQPYGQPATFVAAGEKRKAAVAQVQPIGELEEDSRLAAEEDKRRRNTAASARFRVKKKQREQALEKQTKEMSDKVKQLENKVSQLEMENKWLKGLITEKSDLKGMEDQIRKFAESKDGESKNVDSSNDERNDGVGTELKDEA